MRPFLTCVAASTVLAITLLSVPFASFTTAFAHAVVPTCATSDLKLSTGQSQGAAGHQDLRFHFRNQEMGDCKISGQPHVKLLSSPGVRLPTHEKSGPGYIIQSQAREVVRLKPGQRAYFTMEWEDVPTGSETCPTAAAVRVRPPHARPGITISLPSGGITPCGGRIIVSKVSRKPVG